MPMPIVIATGSIPFRYQGAEYQITNAGIDEHGQAYATVSPNNLNLVDELTRRITAEKTLTVHLAHNYKCFPEDYPAALSR